MKIDTATISAVCEIMENFLPLLGENFVRFYEAKANGKMREDEYKQHEKRFRLAIQMIGNKDNIISLKTLFSQTHDVLIDVREAAKHITVEFDAGMVNNHIQILETLAERKGFPVSKVDPVPLDRPWPIMKNA